MKARLTPIFIAVLLLFIGAALLAGCQGGEQEPGPVAETPTPAIQATQAPVQPTAEPEPETPEVEVPFLEEWQASPHADAEAEAFVHWNEDDPREIPTSCAKCHSTPGIQDYTGADGSAFGTVDKAAEVGTVIACTGCHNNSTKDLSTVIFPSGVELTGIGNEAICMTCHQGTSSMVQVNAAIEESGAADEDTPVAELGFTNIHYYAAAVTRFGTLVDGGYEYPGQSYDALFEHVEGWDECVDCHDSHTLELKVEGCATCHPGVASAEDMRNIRMFGSASDYDGDGDVSEGIFSEIEGVRGVLYEAMRSYASEVAGTPLAYNAAAYPYFFIDTNEDGEAGEDEAVFDNRFASWTPRLAKAAFNYQTSIKDPGQYAHGGKYVIELLYDSTVNLNEKLSTPVSVDALVRTDPGHFDGSSEAFRHWDEEGEVPLSCAKCHSSEGLPQFLENGANINVEISNGLRCDTCHSDLTTFTIHEVDSVRFPSGAVVTMDNATNNLCINCHQGRESTVSVNTAIRDLPPNEPNERLTFRNVHYFAAGASLFGDEVKGAYQFEGKTYLGRFLHVEGFSQCSDCHDAHALRPNLEACAGCHGTEDPAAIRGQSSTADFDGDGDTTEGIAGEVTTMTELLYTALQAYATETLETPIVYSNAAHPYWFIDTNADGVTDPEEVNGDNRYATWSPRLLQSAYNYQFAVKDPGVFVHNGKYILQVLYDSIQNVGGSVNGLVRP